MRKNGSHDVPLYVQSSHATPPLPHAVSVSEVWQVLLVSQQPAQFDAPHEACVHLPAEHVCPEPHDWHEPPPVPHCDADWLVTQVLFAQHPLGHVLALHGGAAHELFVHTWLCAVQSTQLKPPTPQTAFMFPAAHVPFEQQPLAHVLGPQPPEESGAALSCCVGEESGWLASYPPES